MFSLRSSSALKASHFLPALKTAVAEPEVLRTGILLVELSYTDLKGFSHTIPASTKGIIDVRNCFMTLICPSTSRKITISVEDSDYELCHLSDVLQPYV